MGIKIEAQVHCIYSPEGISYSCAAPSADFDHD